MVCTACDDTVSEQETSSQVTDMQPVADTMVTMMDMSVDLPSNHDVYAHCSFYNYQLQATEPQTYPDDALTRVDEQSVTGLRLNMSQLSWSEGQTAFVRKMLTQLDVLDGWGTNAGILMRFDGNITHLNTEMTAEELTPYVQLLMLDDAEALPNYPRQVPLHIRILESGKSIIFEPLLPLKSATRYALVVKTHQIQQAENELTDHCLAQSDVMRDILTADAIPRLTTAYQTAQELSGWNETEIAAATVFTTQSSHQTSFAIADYIRTQEYQWQGEAECSSYNEYRHCIRTFQAHDFRRDGIIQDTTPHDQYELRVHTWIPKEQSGPLATVLYGHGIGGDYGNAYQLINLYSRPKFVIVAIDAVHHGEHPTNVNETVATASVLNFFALNLPEQTIDALQARDNFRQSTYDKLQLLELLHQEPDIDGDGQVDVNPEQIGYYGLSLGGIMGVELLALESRIRACVLAVPGAQLVSVLIEGQLINDILPLIYQLVGGQEIFETFIPLAQVLIDAADPGSYAPFVIHQRVDDLPPPHLLMQMAMNDEVVPNTANRALARALMIPHAQPHAESISFLPSVNTPVSLNLYDRSIALFQFDRVLSGSRAVPSNHNNVPFSKEAHAQSKSFLNQWINKDEPSINDPYPLFETPALE